MLNVVCGEDIKKAFAQFVKLKADYRIRGYRITDITASELPEIEKQGEGITDLFGQATVYACHNISSVYKGRTKTDIKKTVENLAQTSSIVILDFENGKSAYDLSSLKKIASSFNESKPDKNVFELLDQCVPGNLAGFLKTLYAVEKTQDAMFVYTLLWRHVRKLILAAEGIVDSKTAPWQRGKIVAQAGRWDKQKLVHFYEGLAKIDVGMKTSSSTFNLVESIEILACYYLK